MGSGESPVDQDEPGNIKDQDTEIDENLKQLQREFSALQEHSVGVEKYYSGELEMARSEVHVLQRSCEQLTKERNSLKVCHKRLDC